MRTALAVLEGIIGFGFAWLSLLCLELTAAVLATAGTIALIVWTL